MRHHILALPCILSMATAFSGTQPSIRSSSTAPSAATMLSMSDNSSSRSDELSRRQLGELAFAASGLGVTYFGTRERDPLDYGLWGVLPVGTYKKKKTILDTIIPDNMWTFDQKFGILDVQVPLRMTVTRLSSGGLFVYNPVAGTPEMVGMLQKLVDQYGPVKHIAVGSVALEHKVYAGVLAQKFPSAQVWLTPGQYSFPLNLPESFLGFPKSRTRAMPASIDDAPEDWKADFDVAVLGPIISRDGAFAETVFFHKPTKTLLVTDTAVQVTEEVPAIYDSDPSPLLYHARDTITDNVQDTPETRKKGWRRIVLFGLYFTPSAITIKDFQSAIQERRPDINSDFAGIYPWDWDGDEIASWRALTGDGTKPLVAPILQTLLLNRSPVEVLDFADKVSQWPFTRIIPAHLKNNIAMTGDEYRKSFGFLEEKGVPLGYPKPLQSDLQLLLDAEQSLVESGAIKPAPPKVGGQYSRAEIIAKTSYQCRAGTCAPQANP
ncbi:predicted protein [Phaeodactylum tricornutum CCAP 1055/1]|uniref:Uncharacterized protein n=1 Tax=Phaeodactylum tricornutum (strain CCAP 1055/1) TaxID=556484 RepID=B7FVX5_PHATC|nr:predicted protein [Phaeodactylum tricornutum CCAP 1055/1]EEC49481.1 predicted protein [Phaeodactylum tricornutum CCAP 1055/1]|eukprot:XP_002178783.1 predicted protein [Phaeodactylum tricornutum CCAP 1055/1]